MVYLPSYTGENYNEGMSEYHMLSNVKDDFSFLFLLSFSYRFFFIFSSFHFDYQLQKCTHRTEYQILNGFYIALVSEIEIVLVKDSLQTRTYFMF